MGVKLGKWMISAAALALLAAGFGLGAAGNRREEAPAPQVETSGGRISVYYPSEKKLFVYTELGGNCVYTYTLTTPGGPVQRENCR
jgi:hypothetical protein